MIRFPVALRSPFSSANTCYPLTIGSSLKCKLRNLLTLLHRFKIVIKLIGTVANCGNNVNILTAKREEICSIAGISLELDALCLGTFIPLLGAGGFKLAIIARR